MNDHPETDEDYMPNGGEMDGYDPPCCSHCGKAFDDFSDLGCEYCDTRHPGYGVTA